MSHGVRRLPTVEAPVLYYDPTHMLALVSPLLHIYLFFSPANSLPTVSLFDTVDFTVLDFRAMDCETMRK